jgi:PAS domain-containing protein
MDFRIIKNDKILWLCTRVIPIYNDDGVVHRLIGITDDITLRKEKEIRMSDKNTIIFLMVSPNY